MNRQDGGHSVAQLMGLSNMEGWLEGGVGGGLSGPQAGPENKSLSISLKRQSSVLEAVGSHGLRHSFSVSVNVLGWISCFGGPSVHFRIFFSITGLCA